jgi:hypothetical protein
MYTRVGLYLLALLTIAALVGVSTSVLALQPSILARLAWGPQPPRLGIHRVLGYVRPACALTSKTASTG